MAYATTTRRLTVPAPMLPSETHGAYRRLTNEVLSRRKDREWAGGLTETFPLTWADTLLKRWGSQHGEDRRGANLELLKTCRVIAQAQRAGVRADAGDADLRDEAEQSARDAERRIMYAAGCAQIGGRPALPLVTLTAKLWHLEDWFIQRDLRDAWRRLARAAQHGRALLARLCDSKTWRRVLRDLHARAVEGTARTLGLVHKRASLYVSKDGLRRRRGQLIRNAMSLNSVTAVNEHAQEMSIAELAARGPSNREIRRMELMTRIAGFETICKQCNHEAFFVTVTCPSRMHVYRTMADGWGVQKNRKFDGTKPNDAQAYLATQWAAMRSACERWGVELYGFRIAEPNHDGTPHWHMLLFFNPVVQQGTVKRNKWKGRKVAYRLLVRMLRRYFWRNADPGERGAKKHRITVERIDWAKGSAASYVAKYISKNIDGYRVEKDLYGQDTLTSSQHVDAWASTWRIRQFQQIGGAPVTIWRELRRLHPEQAGASALIGFALEAVNITSTLQPGRDAKGRTVLPSEEVERYTAATGFATYLELQGGPRVRRADLRMRLARESTGELGRFGEVMPPRVVGVQVCELRHEEVPAFGIVPATRRRRRMTVQVESERANWVIVDQAREQVPACPSEWRTREAARARIDDAKRRALALSEAVRPWSPVNNCTRPETAADDDAFGEGAVSLIARTAPLGMHPQRMFETVERHRKRGRWHRWERRSTTAWDDDAGLGTEAGDARSRDQE